MIGEYRVIYRDAVIATGSHDYCMGVCHGILRESPWRCSLSVVTISGQTVWSGKR